MKLLVDVLKFVRLPLLIVFLGALIRFSLGVQGVPYAPRGNAMFSIVVVTMITSIYWGALSKTVGGFGWGGTALTGATIGLWSQILIFTLTAVSYLAGVQDVSYFTHWDALNVPEGTVVPMAKALQARAGGLLFGMISGTIVAFIGRALAWFAPGPAGK